MRKLAVRGLLAALLCAGLAPAVRAAEGDEPAPASPWGALWDGLFGGGEKPAAKKLEPEAERPPEPTPAESAETVRRRELNEYFRRMAVCDRLLEIAAQRNDLDMERRVNELVEKVGQLYQQRTAGLDSSEGPAARKPRDRGRAGAARGQDRNGGAGEGEQ
jgi:hypothetical protein